MELEQENVLNNMTCQAQLEAISRTLQEQDTLLADKVRRVVHMSCTCPVHT